MARDERTGLILLIAFLLLAGVLLGTATNGGQAVTNIFSNLINNVDDPHLPSIETQLVPIADEFNPYWVVGLTAVVASLVTLIATLAYAASRRRLPSSWSALLLLIGISAIPLALTAVRLQNDLLAISPPSASSKREGLLLGIRLLNGLALLEAAVVLISFVLLVWSLTHRHQA